MELSIQFSSETMRYQQSTTAVQYTVQYTVHPPTSGSHRHPAGLDIPGYHLRAGPHDRPHWPRPQSPLLQVEQTEGKVRAGF